MQSAVEAVRQFNCFYTRRLGLLEEKHLGSAWTLTEMRVLYELAKDDAPTAARVRHRLGLDAGYLSRIVKRFEAMGLLEREPDPSDARASRLRLTLEGVRTFAAIDARSQDMVARLLEPLALTDRHRVVSAMETIAIALGQAAPEASDPEAIRLRSHGPGDVGWIIARHGAIYAEEQGWGAAFEAHVAEIACQFLRDFDPSRERAFIAERRGERLGAAIVVRSQDDATAAQLRLLIVEPSARKLGLGRRLVAACSQFARDAGYARIKLWTHDCLADARRLYSREGFVVRDRGPHAVFGVDVIGETWVRTLDR